VLRPFELHEPESVADAVSLLERLGREAGVYAGGTELLVSMKEGLLRYTHLLNIKTVAGLDRIDYDQDRRQLRIGPVVTHRTLELSPQIAAEFPLIARAEASVANVRVRNVGTIGGNLCFAEPHSDPGAFLLLYDTQVEAQGPGGPRSFPLAQLFQGPYETCLEEDEILTAVVVPWFPPGMTGAYLKFGYHQRSSLGLGVAVRLDDMVASNGPAGRSTGRSVERAAILEARIAVGSAGPKPVRVPEAEELLRGATAAELLGISSGGQSPLLDRAGRLAFQEVQPTDDIHGSAEYKEHLIRVLLGKAFQSALGL
jgi:carbon-monoxide dehydrogenase medium subunit